MSKYFKKLALPQLWDVELDTNNLEPLQTYDKFQKFGIAAVKQFECYALHVATSYKARPEDVMKATRFLPRELLQLEEPEGWVLSMQGDGYLPAHIDKDRECTINFYFDCKGQKSRFFDYKDRELTVMDTFVAEHGDVYLLNVKEVHDVSLCPDSPRKVFGLTFKDTPYETVLRILSNPS